MLILPLSTLLFIYAFFALLDVGFFIMNISNLIRTGTFTLPSFFATFLFLSGSVLIVWATWYFLQETDWQQTITVWNNLWINQLLGTIFTVN